MLKHSLVLALALTQILTSIPALAAPNQNEFDYPELIVTPRASARLEMEANQEPSRNWTTHIPLQVSALSTLTAGIMTMMGDTKTLNVNATDLANAKDMKTYAALAGIGVGAGWLGITLAMSALHSPYAKSWKEVSALPKGSQREQLTRERMAEEALRSAASTARRIKWLSVITNVGVSGFMAASSGSDASVSMAQLFSGASLALAFSPVVFDSHWIDVSLEQDEYKKKIYAPVASGTMFVEPGTKNVVPGLILSYSF